MVYKKCVILKVIQIKDFRKGKKNEKEILYPFIGYHPSFVL